MTVQINNFLNNDDIAVIDEAGVFKVAEYKRDLSVDYNNAMSEFFASEMNIRRRQLVCFLDGNTGVVVQQGAMQWLTGSIVSTTGVKGVGDMIGKAFRSSVTEESAIKPEYTGRGVLVLEPTYRHLILLNVADFGGRVVLDDGLFLACEDTLKHKTVMRKTVSSALAGNEGMFNLCLEGNGVAALECVCPREELIEIELQNDVVKIDGNMAIAWSDGLEFTVERSGKSLLGSAASGEGLVNVYRGSGKVWMTPVLR